MKRNPLISDRRKAYLVAALLCYLPSVYGQSPGGVSSGLKVWVKADTGTANVDGSGNFTGAWIDQSGNNSLSMVGSSDPQLQQGVVNFNPTVNFDGNDWFNFSTPAVTGTTAAIAFGVFRNQLTPDQQNGFPFNFGSSNAGHYSYSNNGLYTDAFTTDRFGYDLQTGAVLDAHTGMTTNTTMPMNTGMFNIWGTYGGAGAYGIYNNGVLMGSSATNTFATAGIPRIGARDGVAYTGDVSELILYQNTVLTTAEHQRINSYLAVKYGKTLGNKANLVNYVASDGTAIWTASTTYQNNIAGIGRDDTSGLQQKQSQSVNWGNQPIISLGTVAAANAANTGTIAADKQFLVWGDDGHIVYDPVTISGFTNSKTRLGKVWQLQNTNNFNQQVIVYYSTATLNSIFGSNANNFYLVYSDAATGLNGGSGTKTEVGNTVAATVNGVSYTGFVLTFPATGVLYFSFASTLTTCTNYICNGNMEAYTACPGLSTQGTIDYATCWKTTGGIGFSGGQLMVADHAMGCISPAPAQSWPYVTWLDGGSDGKGWLGGHKTEDWQNTLATPLPVGNYTFYLDAAIPSWVTPTTSTIKFYGLKAGDADFTMNALQLLGSITVNNILSNKDQSWQTYSFNLITTNVYDRIYIYNDGTSSGGATSSYTYIDNFRLRSESDFGNLPAAWPVASASLMASDAAWLGQNTGIPNNECATDIADPTDGFSITNAISGAGSDASPWVLTNGGIYTFQVTVNGSGTPKPVYWAMWFDVNGDGDFTDAEDVFQTDNTVHGGPVSTSFSVALPNTGSALGATSGKIRVTGAAVDPGFTKAMNGVGTFFNGEVEDYYVAYPQPLPLLVSRFDARKQGSHTVLNWTAGSEQQSIRAFIVERSTNGKDYTMLGTVPAAGSYAYRYGFTDYSPADGSNYYRLKIAETNGAFSYSETRVLNFGSQAGAILVYPNPAKDRLAVTGLEEGMRLRVVSVDGRLLSSRAANGSTETIPVQGLPAGMYMILAVKNGAVVHAARFCKE